MPRTQVSVEHRSTTSLILSVASVPVELADISPDYQREVLAALEEVAAKWGLEGKAKVEIALDPYETTAARAARVFGGASRRAMALVRNEFRLMNLDVDNEKVGRWEFMSEEDGSRLYVYRRENPADKWDIYGCTLDPNDPAYKI